MRTLSIKLLFILCAGIPVAAQLDTLRFDDHEFVTGEVKGMDKGVLTIETSYSDKDFKIEWNKIGRISTETKFMVTLEDNTKYFGTLRSRNDSIVVVLLTEGQPVSVVKPQIVNLSAYEDNFADRIKASLDIGYDITKARNLRSLTTNAAIGYKAEHWAMDISYNTFNSQQDSTEDVKRTDSELNIRYVLPKRFYLIGTWSLLSNTEQKLDLRSNLQTGLGFFMIRNNKVYWGAKVGINRNLERYSSETGNRNSWEGIIGSELNFFDFGDLSLLFTSSVYPGFTEKGRWRSDSSLNLKYDLPFDFYIRIGSSLNYDNQPAEGAGKFDYVIQTGFGWEWD